MTDDGRMGEWEAPALNYEGDLHEIVLGGMGKSSHVPKDPGEPMKVQG